MNSGAAGGNFSFRMENGQLVPNTPAATTTPPTSNGGATPASGGNSTVSGASETPASGGQTGNSSRGSSTPGSPAGIRHPPPTLLAEVLDLYNTAQVRLTRLGQRMSSLLRDDAALDNATDTEECQVYYDRFCSCLHFMSHAQHAMSDIMLNFSRPPPRQLRARPFMIQSVVQSAVIQSVPIMTASVSASPSPTSGGSAAASAPNTATASATTTGDNASSTTTTTTTSSAGTDPSAEHAAQHAAAQQQAQAQHAAAHAEAVRAAMAQTGNGDGGPSVEIQADMNIDLARMLGGGAAHGGHGHTAHMQPVMVGIEIGPDQAPGPEMAGMISNAIQQALRGQGGPAPSRPAPASSSNSSTAANSTTTTNTSTTSSSAPSGGGGGAQPQVQVQVGPTMTLPLGAMGPPPPPGLGVGNVNSFDPFLPCPSRHLPSPAAGQPGLRSAQVTRQRVVRSAPGSRASSVGRGQQQPQVRAGSRPRDILTAMMGGDLGAGAQPGDQGIVNMIQGVMGQVSSDRLIICSSSSYWSKIKILLSNWSILPNTGSFVNILKYFLVIGQY